jgi:hypothetical protein
MSAPKKAISEMSKIVTDIVAKPLNLCKPFAGDLFYFCKLLPHISA